jgi:hypothetical protein
MVPRYFGDLPQFRERLAKFDEGVHFRGASLATRQVSRRLPPRHPAEIAPGV